MNLSHRNLDEDELSVLQKGLNFAITPKEIPIPHILATIESSISNLTDERQEAVRVAVTTTLKNAKVSKERNLSKKQENAISRLKRDENIVIVPADKGRAVVIMNKTDYIEKVKTLLEDTTTYKPVLDKRRNPNTRTEKDLNQLLSDIRKQKALHDPQKNQLSTRTYYHLRSTDASPATFYGLPKIHKPLIPLRPITSCVGSSTYNLSKHVARILSPLQGNPYTVQNSTDFATKVKKHVIQDDEVMVSYDVVSLFTSIPVDLALEIVSTKLQNDDKLSSRTDLSMENIIKLLKFVLSNSYFVYEQQFYQQIFGCAMGSPVSAIIANLVMQFIEEKALETTQTHPKWWYRFVDDSHSCLRKQDAQRFLTHLNSINPHINFTMEIEKDGCLPFLDTLTKRENNQVTVAVYRKPTHTNKYLDFDSCHPCQHKRTVVRTLLDRAKKIPSTPSAKANEIKYTRTVLRENGYTARFQNSCRRQPKNNSGGNGEPNGSTDAFFTTLPYIQGVSEKLGRILRKEGLKVAYRPIRVLSRIFTKPKDKRDKELITGVVYKLPCKDCDFVYYGQTQRSLKTRAKEHQKACMENDKNSKVAQHANKHSHSFDFSAIAIVDKEKNWNKRIFLEAWHSIADPKAGNEHIQIPSMYKSLMTFV